MKPTRLLLSILLLLSVAVFAAAQNADKNSAGPTKNDYRLRLVQPLEGAKITGSTVQVVVDTTIPAERDTKVDVNSMPRPRIDVFLDEVYQATMGDTNVVDLERVSYGPHTVTLLAKNMSGEVIDRKVVDVYAMAPPAPPVVARPSAPQPVVAPPPPPAPAPPPAEPFPVVAQEEPRTMPKTGTSDGLVAIAGLVLLAGGIVVRRLV
jgi:LPXTG-motif cell wall-anchored protein